MNKNDNKILEAKSINKRYGGVIAVDNIDMYLRKKEILGIVGDNGAGKSTLIGILAGAIKGDSGDIFIEGKKVEINEPADAKKLGIETVYQHLGLIDELNVPANIFLGREITNKGFLNEKLMLKKSSELLDKMGIKISDLKRDAKYFSGGQKQAISLSRSVYWGKKIVILDEPTAALGVKESKKILDLIIKLKGHGLSAIVISHNLQHIFNIVDRIMVIRRGKKVGEREVHETDADEIVKMITGANVILEKV